MSSIFKELVIEPFTNPDRQAIPRLERRGKATQLIVGGEPFLVLGGELHNSTSSTLRYMDNVIWPRLADMPGLNTVLVPMYWEQIEPDEGVFDFELVDGLILGARTRRKRIVPLWFGSWRTSLSAYAPWWVKTNPGRFPRVEIPAGSIEILSPMGEETCAADARAFATLMRRIREVDAENQTVIMVQVENEIGLFADSRDRSPVANAAFGEAVPERLIAHLVEHRDELHPEIGSRWATSGYAEAGSWEEVFGASAVTDAAFMAWHFAKHTNAVVLAGKTEYPLPMFVNAPIEDLGDTASERYGLGFLAGGPNEDMLDIWRAAAPDVEMFCPDVYSHEEPSAHGRWSWQAPCPVFIPEAFGGREGAALAYRAIGTGALGLSVYGIDTTELLNDTTDDRQHGHIPAAYEVLDSLTPLVIAAQASGNIWGVMLTEGHRAERHSMGEYTVVVRYPETEDAGSVSIPFHVELPAYAIIIQVDEHEFLVVGNDVQVFFQSATPGPPSVGFLRHEQGTFQDGRWWPLMRINGTQSTRLNHDTRRLAANDEWCFSMYLSRSLIVGPLGGDDRPIIQRVKLYRY